MPFKTRQALLIFHAVALFLVSASTGKAQVSHHIAAANIVVVQNDTNNTSASVTVSTSLSINDFRIRSGSNRGDYNVQVGDVSTDDVPNGILMTSLDQNGRDNNEDAYPGRNFGTCSIDSNASSSPGSSGEYWIATFQAPDNDEFNFNVAAAWFPYADGWYGGWLNNATGVNGGANNHLIANSALHLGAQVVDNGSGRTTIDLRSFGLDSRSNAVLLVEGGKNEANFALSATNTDGTWTIFCHDDNGGYEQDYVAFVCVPLTNHTVVSGRFMGDGAVALQSQPFTVVNSGVGTYHLTIPGINPANGVLIISAEGGDTYNSDNMVSYQMNNGGWDIQTRDITTGFTPALQNLPDTNAVVSFVYIPGPTPGATSLYWTGAPATNWNLSGGPVWRATNGVPTNYSDGCQTFLDDTASAFMVNLTGSVSPYALTVSNSVNNYFIGGTGSISGTTGLTKLGTGKLTLATANQYTGNTVISQGTLALAANNVIPNGAGAGNTSMNGTLDLAGFNCAINNLSGNGAVDNSSPGTTVQLTVNQTTNSGFSGVLKNTGGALGLNVSGSGILTLSGGNLLSGGCTVANGTLLVTGALPASSPVNVFAGGQLGGTGTIAGPISLADGAALDLSASVPLTTGTLNVNGTVAVNILTGVSLAGPATYTLMHHGTRTGTGFLKLVQPPGLRANGLVANLVDSGAQLQMVVTFSGVTGTIADVRHVVVLMDENRSFDHFFGTLHGVRGYNDRNALRFQNQNSVFYQPSGSSYELPFHTAIQCLTDLNHTWPVTHATFNGGKIDQWIAQKGAETMVHFDRTDLPYYYALADSYTICDEYHCSVISCTDPNRVSLMTGWIDPNSTGGGPEIDNSSIAAGFTWKTYPELLQQAGISWKVFLVAGDSADNVLPLFAAFKQARSGNPLYDRGRAGVADVAALVSSFKSQVQANTLPAVSWLIGPGQYTEHPPNSPANGEVLAKQLIDAVASNPTVYNSTVFILNYDENDGFFDHAIPILPPPGATNEYVGNLPVGLGVRVPCMIISPWTRGGRVCSQVFDHTSVIRFLENWTGVMDPNISPWRRQVSGDLTSAFDFAHPNTTIPLLVAPTGATCPDGTTPDVPTSQALPAQETGSLTPMPLPYQPDATCALNLSASTVAISMTNSGAASYHFAIYPNAYRTDGPWPFDVNTSNATNTTFSTAITTGKYDFSCYGPNGFQRRYAGNINNDYQKIEALSFYNQSIAGLKIELQNPSSSAVTFTVSNGYAAGGVSNYSVPARNFSMVNIASETNNGFYDATVTTSADSLFVRRFMGRVEIVGPPLPLISSKNPCSFGDSVTFTCNVSGYGVPSGTVRFSTNGVPVSVPLSLVNGTVSFTLPSFGCTNLVVTADYSGDIVNSPATYTLTQVVTLPPPTITLYGNNPMTNWQGTPFVDPGALAFDLCADLLPITTNGIVDTTSPGTYLVQYIAGNTPANLATNARIVLVVGEAPPVISGGATLPDGSFQFSFNGPASQPYRVVTTTNLATQSNWDVILTGTFGPDPATFTDTNASAQSARFYRVVSP